jgi:hypothetical protein
MAKTGRHLAALIVVTALLVSIAGVTEGRSLRNVDLKGLVDAPDLKVEGGRFETKGAAGGWKTTFVTEPADYQRKEGLVLDLQSRKDQLGETGTIAFWIYRGPETGGSNYNTVLSLTTDNTTMFDAFVTWRARHSGAMDNVTALRLGGEAYLADGSPVFGRNVLFDRQVAMGEWVHLAITWGPNGPADNRILLNGKEAVAYQAAGGEPAPRSGTFGKYVRSARSAVIGSSRDGIDTFYQGLIGEVSLYDTIETNFDLTKYRPNIRSLTDNFFQIVGINGVLVAGDRISVKMEADPGGSASCDIGTETGVPMTEDPNRPGFYAVDHSIRPGNYLDRGRIVGHLKGAGGVDAEPARSASGDLSIDARSRFLMTIDKTDLPADSSATSRVKVKTTDANGNPVKDHLIKVTLSTTDEYTGLVGSGSARYRDAAAATKDMLGGADVETRWKGITDSWGEVEFDFKSGFAAKTIILQAKDMTSGDVGVDYITSYKEASIDIVLTAPISLAAARRGLQYLIKVEATRTELTADGRSRSVIRATVQDPTGKPVAGDTVVFSLSSANGTLNTIKGTTDASGVATAEYIAGKKIGIVVVTATDTVRNISGSVSITLLADAPAKIILRARPETMPADGNSRADIQVKVTDINDNPNRDTKVEFLLSRGSGKMDFPDRVTDRFGDAANRFTAGTTPGIATIVATVRSKIPTVEELAKAQNVLFVPYSDAGEDIRIVQWLKKAGDTALRGEPIVEYTIGRGETKYLLNAPYDCRIDLQFVEYWDNAKTGDTLAQITPVVIPGSTNTPPPAPSLSPRRR